MRKWLMGLVVVWAVAAGVSAAPKAAGRQVATAALKPVSAVAAEAPQYQALVDQYCVGCHNDRVKIGDLSLEKRDIAHPQRDADSWEKVLRKMKAGMMPPLGLPRPSLVTYDSFVSFLETSLAGGPAASSNPGRPHGVHRLNRVEYANAIRDLLALDVNVGELLPPDESSSAGGFDNNADVLGVSTTLQEQYLRAAEKVTLQAIGDPSTQRPGALILKVPGDVSQVRHQEGLPIGTRGGYLFDVFLPADASYDFQARLYRENNFHINGMDQRHTFVVTIDNELAFKMVVGGKDDLVSAGDPLGLPGLVDDRLHFKKRLSAGPHKIGMTFLERSQAEVPWTLQPFDAVLDQVDSAGLPRAHELTISGPIDPTGPGKTPSRQRIFTCRPATRAEEAGCARTILETLARRAYRRPVTPGDMQVLMKFFETGRSESSFESAIGLAMRYVLTSPDFLFRIENEPALVAPGAPYRLTDLEIASRLSFFIWSSIPDDRLLTVASQGRLSNPAVFQQEVSRMMADPKARTLTQNFTGQWLQLRNLNNTLPNFEQFPDFDDNLRQSMRRETEMLFQSIIDEDRSVVTLLDADYTFLNERLATHYGIPNIRGSRFRRVPVTDENRRGLLGQASILTVTSVPDRTSPVKRGKWVLENLLGVRPPDPPPNVPPLKEPDGNVKPKTLREELEAHRQNPVCASCHRLFDPIGFALDNFDGIGKWRDIYPGTVNEVGSKIDASGQLANGTPLSGPMSIRKALLRKPEYFVDNFAEKLMTYALGRTLQTSDLPAVRAIVKDAAANDYRFSSIFNGIVNSPMFQMRTKAAPTTSPVGTVTRASR